MFFKPRSRISFDSFAREQATDRLRGMLVNSRKEPSAANRAAQRWFVHETPNERPVVAEITRHESEPATDSGSTASYSFRFTPSFMPNGRG